MNTPNHYFVPALTGLLIIGFSPMAYGHAIELSAYISTIHTEYLARIHPFMRKLLFMFISHLAIIYILGRIAELFIKKNQMKRVVYLGIGAALTGGHFPHKIWGWPYIENSSVYTRYNYIVSSSEFSFPSLLGIILFAGVGFLIFLFFANDGEIKLPKL